MRQVMEQYASAIVAVLVAGVILCFFWGGESVLSKELQMFFFGHGFDKYSLQTGRAFDDEKDVIYPKIQFHNTYAIVAGQKVRIEDVYRAIAEDASILSIEIIGCWRENGNVVPVLLDEGGFFSIDEAGIYWMKLSATDTTEHERIVLVQLFVNER